MPYRKRSPRQVTDIDVNSSKIILIFIVIIIIINNQQHIHYEDLILNKINIYNTSCVLICESLLLFFN